MKDYIFRTTTTMKEYNSDKWWIDSKIIPEIRIQAESVNAAIKDYREEVENKYYVSISNNAMEMRKPTYIDTPDGTKQAGFVITGKTYFEDRSYNKSSYQYIDLWVKILTVVDTEF